MSQKTIRSIGWILTIVLGILLIMSASMKLFQTEAVAAQVASMGFSADTYRIIGIVEIISLILFIIPRTGVIGALLLIAYMGGAIATHVQHQQPLFMPVVVEIVLWIAAVLRFPELKQRLLPAAK